MSVGNQHSDPIFDFTGKLLIAFLGPLSCVKHLQGLCQGELEPWAPSDFQESPPFLTLISDEKRKSWAKSLMLWPHFGHAVRFCLHLLQCAAVWD